MNLDDFFFVQNWEVEPQSGVPAFHRGHTVRNLHYPHDILNTLILTFVYCQKCLTKICN